MEYSNEKLSMKENDKLERKAKCQYHRKTTERGYKRGSCESRICLENMKENGRGDCTCIRLSSSNLAFFRAEPDLEFDTFYCGCQGWD